MAEQGKLVSFEINLEDLTLEAQQRLRDIVGDELACGPISILEFYRGDCCANCEHFDDEDFICSTEIDPDEQTERELLFKCLKQSAMTGITMWVSEADICDYFVECEEE